jgi:type II secretory pathway pseudopilin PulG
MQRRVFLPKFQVKAVVGHTLVELLVAIFISGVVMAMITTLMRTSVSTREKGGLETEAQQGLRGLISMVTQELRQAGACLSTTGPFIALTGTDNSDRDTLTLRLGKVNATTLLCVVATASAAASGATSIQVDDVSGFQVGDRLYIRESNATGSYNSVTAIDTNAKTLTLTTALANAFTAGAGVYAIEERTYAVGTINGRPALTLSIDSGTASPLVEGVQVFDVLYYLGPCSLNNDGTLGCANAIAAPTAGSAQWNQVQAIGVRAAVSAHKNDRHSVTYQATTDQAGAVNGYVMVKPRNLL